MLERILAASITVLFGGVFLYMAFLLFRQNRAFRRNRVAVEGVVVGFDLLEDERAPERSEHVIVEHPVPNAEPARTTASNPGPTFRIGDRVTVWIDPGDPAEVQLPGDAGVATKMLYIFGALGVSFVVVTALLLFA